MANEAKKALSPEAQARIDFVRSVVPRRKPRKLVKASVLIVLVLLASGVVLLIASGSYKTTKAPTPVKVSAPPASPLSATTTGLNYSSKFFGLGLSYPKTWTLKDNGKGLLQITSPLTNLVADSGNSQKGAVVLTISTPGQLPTGLTAGTDLAVLDSTVLSYANPSQDQSGQVYISFVQYSTTNIKGGLDGVYATGNYGYQEDQVIPTTIFSSPNPLIFVSFRECSNNLCTKEAPLTIAASSWTSTPLGQIITNIIQSFVFN